MRLERSVDLGHASRMAQRGADPLLGSDAHQKPSNSQALASHADGSPVKVCLLPSAANSAHVKMGKTGRSEAHC